ncbi:hypothetical protein WMY93_008336 [Mugilogobius chulae]|uniref:VPS37 C-terminal domain-containing protein n=1 Tax=Mugilogobius chulae TaxID=88201 RepID=A0AAW0PFX4_9GOBI
MAATISTTTAFPSSANSTSLVLLQHSSVHTPAVWPHSDVSERHVNAARHRPSLCCSETRIHEHDVRREGGQYVPDGYRELSTEELQELLQDDGKMEQIIRLNEKFQELQLDRESLLSSNRSLAEESLSQRPRLDTGKAQLADKYRELSNLATSCWDKQSQLEARGHRGSVQSAQNLLQEEVARAEEQSEELLDKFMEGNLALDDFLDSFHQWRRTYHIRRAQAEKMQELSQAKPSKPRSGTGADADPPPGPQDKPDSEPTQDPHRPNGFLPQGPLRVFQVRYGLTPAILVPHYPVSPTGNAPCHHPAPLQPPPLPSAHGPAVGLRLIGQLPGGWASGRPVRVQQLYRPNPAQTEPPCR